MKNIDIITDLKDIKETLEGGLVAENIATKDGNNVQEEIDSLKLSVSNGKELIATAIADKGVDASGTDTFVDLANKINSIESETSVNLPMLTPSFTPNVGSIAASCDRLYDNFKEFKIDDGNWQYSNVFTDLKAVTSYVFHGKYGGSKTSSISVITPRANQSKPESPAASLTTLNSVVITTSDNSKIKHGDILYDSPYKFTNLTPNTTYDFYSVYPETTSLNESSSDALNVKTLSQNGYYGKVNGIITADDLRSLTGCTFGAKNVTEDITWLKFTYNGKLLYIADRCISSGISWDQINSVQCADGKIIVINGDEYKCRLILGGEENPSSAPGREWNNTIAKYTPDNEDSNWQNIWTWCLERDTTSSGLRILRGYGGVSNYGTANSYDAHTLFGWRPVLEVL